MNSLNTDLPPSQLPVGGKVEKAAGKLPRGEPGADVYKQPKPRYKQNIYNFFKKFFLEKKVGRERRQRLLFLNKLCTNV